MEERTWKFESEPFVVNRVNQLLVPYSDIIVNYPYLRRYWREQSLCATFQSVRLE